MTWTVPEEYTDSTVKSWIEKLNELEAKVAKLRDENNALLHTVVRRQEHVAVVERCEKLDRQNNELTEELREAERQLHESDRKRVKTCQQRDCAICGEPVWDTVLTVPVAVHRALEEKLRRVSESHSIFEKAVLDARDVALKGCGTNIAGRLKSIHGRMKKALEESAEVLGGGMKNNNGVRSGKRGD